MARITVTNQFLASINPFLYGNFMEFIERHISGMWAEMLENRRLEDHRVGQDTASLWI